MSHNCKHESLLGLVISNVPSVRHALRHATWPVVFRGGVSQHQSDLDALQYIIFSEYEYNAMLSKRNFLPQTNITSPYSSSCIMEVLKDSQSLTVFKFLPYSYNTS